MRVMVKIPTRERGLSWLSRWTEKKELSETVFVVSIDSDDRPTIAQSERRNDAIFITGARSNKIEACNRDVSRFVGKFDLLILGSDDMIPSQGYDRICAEESQKLNGKDGIIWFTDGYQNRICTIPVMTAGWYNKFGYIYHPSYKSLWCDNEYTDVAVRNEAAYMSKMQNVFIHRHPANTKEARLDNLYNHNNRYFEEDKANYTSRKIRRFPK